MRRSIHGYMTTILIFNIFVLGIVIFMYDRNYNFQEKQLEINKLITENLILMNSKCIGI